METSLSEAARAESFPRGRAWIDDSLSIMRIGFEPHTRVTLELARAQVAVMQRLAAGRLVPCLVDMRDIISADRAAREFYAGPETHKVASACAMIIGGSGVAAAIGNFMIALYGPKIMPMRLFRHEADAVAWLRTFV